MDMDVDSMDHDSLAEVELPQELEALSNVLDSKPEALATGDKDIQLAALRATKFIYDMALKSEARSRAAIAELLTSISPERARQTRSRTFTMAMVEIDPKSERERPSFKETPLTELYVEGMNDDQVWEQLELRAKNLCELIDFSTETSLEGPGNDEKKMEELRNMMRMNGMDENGMDEDADEDDHEYGESDDDDDDDDEDSHEDEDEEDEGDEVLGEHVAELKDPSDSEDEDEDIDLDKPSLLSRLKRPSKRKSKARARGHPELDDDFFDLATFNAETEAAEANTVSKGRLSAGDDDEEEDLEEDGLVDYLAPVDDGADADQGGLFYRDFFDPPPRESGSKPKQPQAQAPKSGRVRFHEEVRVKQIKAKGKNLPLSMLYGDDDDDDDEDEYGEDEDEDEDESEDDDEEVEKFGANDKDLALDEDEDDFGAMDDEMDEPNEELDGSSDEDDFTMEAAEHLKDDLFAEDENIDTEMTTHQKRMAKLQEEIAALEAENVGKKNWTLMGEASSRTRPQNSLLEEDLEFEHIMKSVPVITEEIVLGLEERIKSRILESQFDDVVRKRPVDDKPFLPSRVFELQDTKSKQSLAEIYEDEYTAAQAGTLPGEDRDGKLKKEHDEITKIWESISSKLDALSNAHFTPKAPKATISTISNVAATSMESALPTTKSTSTMLAPEEMFAPSSSDLRARSELTPAQKRAARNKQKKQHKKARDSLEKSVDKFAKVRTAGGIKKQKGEALKTLTKTGKGVTVIGKKSKELKQQENGKKHKSSTA